LRRVPAKGGRERPLPVADKGSSKEWRQHNEMRRKAEIELMLQQARLREIPSSPPKKADFKKSVFLMRNGNLKPCAGYRQKQCCQLNIDSIAVKSFICR